jgi:Protein of unknown function (DUF2889)
MSVLPAAAPRTELTKRDIACRAYVRQDGLIDVEGTLVDVRAYDTENRWRGKVTAGNPVHAMHVRLTFGDDRVVREVAVSMEQAPFPTCREVEPNLQRLVGLAIGPGFNREMQRRIGHTEGCTHVVTLVQALANVAVQALAGKARQAGADSTDLTVFGGRTPGRPPLIDTCRSYEAGSPIVQVLFPDHYRGPDARKTGQAEPEHPQATQR